jgi:general secretion pathway protein L
MASENQRFVAVCDDKLMAKWVNWLGDHGLVPDHIVPIQAIIPAPDSASPTAWARVTMAGETILRSSETAFVADADLVRHIVSGEGEVQEIGPDAMERAMVAALDDPPLDLRCGPWAKSRPAVLDSVTLRRAAWLGATIILASIAILVAAILRVHAGTRAIDHRAAADVATVLRSPPPIEQALPQLDARLAALGASSAGLSAPYSALVASLEPSPTVAVDALSWRGDGTLAVTLGAPRTEDINAVLIALQARGYIITATPRSGTDGRALGDITIRSLR